MSKETKYFIQLSQSYASHNSAQKQVSLLEQEINGTLIIGEDQFKTFISDLQSKIDNVNISNKRCKDISFRIYDHEKAHNYVPGTVFNWSCPAGYSFYAEGCFSASVYVAKKEIYPQKQIVIRKKIISDFISIYYFTKSKKQCLAVSYDKRDDFGLDSPSGTMFYDIEMHNNNSFVIDNLPTVNKEDVPDAVLLLLTFLNN